MKQPVLFLIWRNKFIRIKITIDVYSFKTRSMAFRFPFHTDRQRISSPVEKNLGEKTVASAYTKSIHKTKGKCLTLKKFFTQFCWEIKYYMSNEYLIGREIQNRYSIYWTVFYSVTLTFTSQVDRYKHKLPKRTVVLQLLVVYIHNTRS